eukprot:TRINITY_DN1481_c0_g1_i1.p1 TRINITY_DN1481_c0_g1~~TRINITY_DN1481_c0_g1_i1.p1  ORF type:complete len:148 (-),score=15.11 TRINITY_DN1481_c0_g1_i1:809-1252(-)
MSAKDRGEERWRGGINKQGSIRACASRGGSPAPPGENESTGSAHCTRGADSKVAGCACPEDSPSCIMLVGAFKPSLARLRLPETRLPAPAPTPPSGDAAPPLFLGSFLQLQILLILTFCLSKRILLLIEIRTRLRQSPSQKTFLTLC